MHSLETIPFGQRMFQVDFDFIDHRLAVQASGGRSRSMPLVARSVADFYIEFMSILESEGIQVKINTPRPTTSRPWLASGQATASSRSQRFVAGMFPEPPGCRMASFLLAPRPPFSTQASRSSSCRTIRSDWPRTRIN